MNFYIVKLNELIYTKLIRAIQKRRTLERRRNLRKKQRENVRFNNYNVSQIPDITKLTLQFDTKYSTKYKEYRKESNQIEQDRKQKRRILERRRKLRQRQRGENGEFK